MTNLDEIIARARHLAAERHVNDVRPGPRQDPLFVHLEAVAAALPPRLKPIGYLHDYVEHQASTRGSLEELRALDFPEYVVAGVDSLTRRKGETYVEFIERICLNPDAIPAKIEDVKHNMQNPFSDSLMKRYAKALPRLQAALRAISLGPGHQPAPPPSIDP